MRAAVLSSSTCSPLSNRSSNCPDRRAAPGRLSSYQPPGARRREWAPLAVSGRLLRVTGLRREGAPCPAPPRGGLEAGADEDVGGVVASRHPVGRWLSTSPLVGQSPFL